MSTAEGRGGATRAPRPPSAGRPLPFWALQLAELVAAVVLVDVSVHVRAGGVLIAVAGAFALLAAVAEGPLGLVRVCPQRLHVALVVGVAALAAAAPVVPALRPDVEGIIVLEFAAVGIIRAATLTRTSDRPRSVPGRPERVVIDATASVVDRTTPAPPASSRPPSAPPPDGAPGPEDAGAARRAGRAAGAAAATGRHLAETHGPAARAHLRRSIRTAGRWAGRVGSRVTDSRPPGS